MYYVYNPYELQHHGIKGQKWGVRRFQKKDGTLTSSGKKRYSEKAKNVIKTQAKKYVDKRNAKEAERKEKLHKTVDRWGAPLTTWGKKQGKAYRTAARATTAVILNSAANAYIASGQGSYKVNQGVHYARKAAIYALSVSEYKDMYKTYRDIGEAWIYQFPPKSKSKKK